MGRPTGASPSNAATIPMPEKFTPHEIDLGVQTEVGGTVGLTHERVLEQTLGHERALDLATRHGPPIPKVRVRAPPK